MSNRLRQLMCLSAALLCVFSSAQAVDFSKYHNYEEVTSILLDLVGQNENLAKLVEIGKSREDRSIWLVQLAQTAGIPVRERPALLVAANFEGDQLFGSELALYMVDYLLGASESDDEVKRLLQNHVVYVLPRVNPDGAEMMFARAKSGRKTNSRPYDDDNDGRVDEDDPEDLNGDGFISLMRVGDPEGELMVHPDEPRLLRRANASKGEAGVFKVYWEGIDSDHDGFMNEDPAGGVDLNRNFQHKYPYYSVGAGPHMVSEPEARAVLDWLLEHRNVVIILAFGGSDNLVTAPNSRGELGPANRVDLFDFARQSVADARQVGMFEIESLSGSPFGRRGAPPARPSQRSQQRIRRPVRLPQDKINSADLPYFQQVSEKYREICDVKSNSSVRSPEGAFFEYGYYQFGVLALSTPGWGLPAEGRREGEIGRPSPGRSPTRASEVPTGPRQGGIRPELGPPAQRGIGGRTAASSDRPEESGTARFDLRLLEWMDDQGIDGFIEWESYSHPELGEVEIGGFRPYAVSNPPAERIPESGRRHCDFILHLASLFPEVSIVETSVTELGGSLFRIKAEIENSGFLPTALAHGVESKAVKPTMVQLGIRPEDLISGNAKTSFFQALAGSGRRQKFEWIVRGEAGTSVTLEVVAQKGGTDIVTLRLD